MPGTSLKQLILCLFTSGLILLSNCDSSSPTVPADEPSCTLVWEETFDEGLGGRWRIADWTFDNNLCEFSSRMVNIEDDQLVLAISKKERGGSFADKPYWGAEIYTTAKYQYGLFKTLLKPNSPPGVITSFFLMDGVYEQDVLVDWFEIDIEFPGSTTTISYALHWMVNGELKSTSTSVSLGFDAAVALHEYAIEWTASSIRFLVDGTVSATFNDATIMRELQHPMSIHMNYWVSASPAWAGAFDERKLPLRTIYDSVSYYKLTNT
ncbi:family 16 glycosylhydrolase [candidate division KSB1 bacterium]|nr:family 16 glycosylhydrolase [candidate division KSB1 bacterium]